MRGGKRSICGEPLGAQCERFELPADRCRLSTVSYSGWLIPRGGAIAPVSKLHVLFEGVTYADGAVETEDDVDGAHLFVAEVSVTEVADAATLDLPEHTTTAIEFSGRKVVHFDIALVDRLAPDGGWFVYEDGDVDEIAPADAPAALREVASAVLRDDADTLKRALGRVPESDDWRLPKAGLERLARSHPSQVLERFVTEDVDPDMERRIAASRWADDNDANPTAATLLVQGAVRGDLLARAHVEAWAERYRSCSEPRQLEQRTHFGHALVQALAACEPTARGIFIPWLRDLEYWEEVEDIALVVRGDKLFDELLAELRELADDEPVRRAECDFSGLI